MLACSCEARVVGVFLLSFLTFSFALLLYCELIHHYLVIAQCDWPVLPPDGDDPGLRVVFVADTHLLGSRRGHWFDKLRREWQMHRTYVSSAALLRPELVVFLGDLYDEGKWCSAEEFRQYVARFDSLFPVSDGLRRLVVAGNHDIGFHYSVTSLLSSRFETAHGTSGVAMVTVADGVHFVLVNSVAMQGDSCYLCQPAEKQLDHTADTLDCAERRDAACLTRLGANISTYSRPILVQHYPLYRQSDAGCSGSDSAPASERSVRFRPGWECLTRPASERLLTRLRPRLVVSGHTHHYCLTQHRTQLGDVPEYSVPSLSWRNKQNPSLLMMRITARTFSVSKCRLAEEPTVIALYLVGAPVALVLSFIVTARRRVIRRWNAVLEQATAPRQPYDDKLE